MHTKRGRWQTKPNPGEDTAESHWTQWGWERNGSPSQWGCNNNIWVSNRSCSSATSDQIVRNHTPLYFSACNCSSEKSAFETHEVWHEFRSVRDSSILSIRFCNVRSLMLSLLTVLDNAVLLNSKLVNACSNASFAALVDDIVSCESLIHRLKFVP